MRAIVRSPVPIPVPTPALRRTLMGSGIEVLGGRERTRRTSGEVRPIIDPMPAPAWAPRARTWTERIV